MKAIWNNKVIAESNDIVTIEGIYYFPKKSVKTEYLKESITHSVCHWKGEANYYSIEVDGRINADAAWSYPKPNVLASSIEGHVAFWKGVQFVED
jgi:Uncharacterized protein conserved in bacteria